MLVFKRKLNYNKYNIYRKTPVLIPGTESRIKKSVRDLVPGIKNGVFRYIRNQHHISFNLWQLKKGTKMYGSPTLL